MLREHNKMKFPVRFSLAANVFRSSDSYIYIYIYFSLKEGQHNPTWKNKDRTSSFPDWTNFESKHFTRLLE